MPELLLVLKRYSVGIACQLLRNETTVSVLNIEDVRTGPRTSEKCYVLENGERIIVTSRTKLERPADVDGVIRLYDDGGKRWISHKLLDQAMERTVAVGMKSRSAAIAGTWPRSFRFAAQEYDAQGKPIGDRKGLRPPQLGALYAIGSHWTQNSSIATVVMPTGTGKTETMLSALAAFPRGPMVVAVPSKALRNQTTRKFLTFGLLRKLTLLPEEVENPIVGLLSKQPGGENDLAIFEDCNVVVSAMASLTGGKAKNLASKIANRSGVLIVDEAHHVAATSWSDLRSAFSGKYTLQFTATPFREDGKLVDGDVIYSYSLRKAQEDGYFKPIKFLPVHELHQDSADDAIAHLACKTLREDLAVGNNHLIMARCSKIDRAQEILMLYRVHGSEFSPQIIHSELQDSQERINRLITGDSRIAVCVNMLGEGFDLPPLKIAALHDPQKSLAPLLQFTGRFTRTSGEHLGDATVIANITDTNISSALERLYSEDSDWNVLLSEMSSEASRDHAQLVDFLNSSISLGEDREDAPSISHHLLRPVFSTLTYNCPAFSPKKFHEAISKDVEVTRVWLHVDSQTLYFVTRSKVRVKWSRSKDLVETDWHLFVLHFDEKRNLLYLASSDKTSNHAKLAAAVGATTIIDGEPIFKSLGNIGRLVFNNLGVSKHGRRNLSYAMYTGANVRDALTFAAAPGSRKANLSGSGWERGKHVTIGCSYKGRVWSKESGTIPQLIGWSEAVGEKLLDATITTEEIIENVLIPIEVTSLPDGEIMGIEWPFEILRQSEDRVDLSLGGKEIPIYLCDIQLSSVDRAGNSIRFELLDSQADVLGTFDLKIGGPQGFEVVRVSDEEIIFHVGSKEFIAESYFSDYPPLVRYFDLTELDGNLVLRPENPYNFELPEDSLDPWDWVGVDITRESIWKDGFERRNSVQWAAAQKFINDDFEVVIDDDGPGEAADLVCLKEEAHFIRLVLVHCKFSKSEQAGNRVGDVAEVASQAIRSAKWAGRFKELCRHITNRARRPSTGHRTFVLNGNIADVNKLLRASRFKEVRPEIVIVQPGISRTTVSGSQKMLLAAAASYIKETVGVELVVACSE
ncbi:DEAD/DEAH box helicase [Dyadobacter fermentans]|nr:DEAD/DEAH box helicase family protein [Dyadobacter fermentans]